MLRARAFEDLSVVTIKARVEPFPVFCLVLIWVEVWEVVELSRTDSAPQAFNLAHSFRRFIHQHAENLPPQSIYRKRLHDTWQELRVVAL